MKVTLIYNPGAGADQQPSRNELLEMIRRAGHVVIPLSIEDNHWEDAVCQPTDLVAIAGGDGTVGRIAKRLVGTSTPIAVLPMGTANNIARTLDLLNRPIAELIAAWPAARRVKFDVGVANGPWGESKYFIEGLGIGLFTGTMSRLDFNGNIEIAHLDAAGEKITSVLEILKERLPSYPAKNLKISADRQDISGEYILLEVMNIKSVGPNLHLAPDADPCDGVLDIVCVSQADQEAFSRYLTEFIEGKIAPPALPTRKARHLEFLWEGFAVHIDDEVWPDKIPQFPLSSRVIDVQVRPDAVEFLALG
jgi:diacylglycerol kinase family enzyme